MQLVSEVKGEWSQDIEKEQAGRILDYIARKDFVQLTNEERYLLQFRLRAVLYVLQKSHILVPKLREISLEKMLLMAKDFAYENYDIYEEMKALIQGVLL
ncbi:hypothetical protein SAMN02746066_01627 [Anaerosporobacter mobilis DSM 15930]|jgi:hypothetical protein|uniref:Uncharacterized protein n=1 Tax=Anaerosporobacter mobilis DSM 15930 TaxID=1120996 RepID=A0A1M7HWR1_9FIRM|nr:hypothetical protein [Anaerosporobacter mobilis]SHM32915.1 hypothetical protein SAMN02746066_01627 [Anaerosporobacter mobilis DSM 15930]